MERRRPSQRAVALCAGLACVLAVSASMAAEQAATERARLEAAILFNLLQFVEWPDEAAQGQDARFTLCVDSASPFYAVAQQLSDKPLRKMKLSVQALGGTSASCKALFVDSPASQRAAAIADAKDALLVVAGTRYPASEQATVSLLDADGRLTFDISQRKARQAGLQISSRLLRLARRVTE